MRKLRSLFSKFTFCSIIIFISYSITSNWKRHQPQQVVAKNNFKFTEVTKVTANVDKNLEKLKKLDEEMRKNIRCKIEYYGTFYPTSKLQKIRNSASFEIPSKHCVEFCGKRNFSFAVIFQNKNNCLCDNDASNLINLRHIDCSKSKSCVQLHHIVSCSIGVVSEEELVDKHLGCFQIPSNIKLITSINDVISPRECWWRCGQRGQVLSLWQPNSCRCTRFTARFFMLMTSQRFQHVYIVNSFNLQHRLSHFYNCATSNHALVYVTWAEDKRCSKMQFFNADPKNRVVLTSVPGSGNTWLRYLVEKASGYFTGSIYRDTPVFRKGFLGEMTRGGILIKHHLYEDELKRFNAIVFIIRDPYQSMISEFQRQKTKSHTGVVEKDRFKSDFVIYDKETLRVLATKLLASQKPIYIIHYNDLVRDPINEVRKLLDFPPLAPIRTNDVTERLFCLSASTTGPFRRHHKPIDFDPFNDTIKQEVNGVISDVRQLLNARGFSLPAYEKPLSGNVMHRQ